MTKKIGFGLIGCGVWGGEHARTLAGSSKTKFVGVYDMNYERAKKFAQKYDIDFHYKSIYELLDNKNIEAVSIATPDFTHTELIVAALEAGKHVLVEKPLATTIEDCNKILDVYNQKDSKLMVNYSNRWKTPFIQVKRLVESGELGELQMMNLKLNDTIYVPTKMLSWASQSNSLHFLGTHLIDLVRWISQSEFKRVYSVSRSVVLKKLGIDTPDFYQSILELTNGATVYMENCWIISENAPNIYDFKAEFTGSKGTVDVDVSHHRMIEKYSISGASLLDVNDNYDLNGNQLGQISIQHFIDCIINDTQPFVTAHDGLEATRIAVALEESSLTGEPIEIL